MCGFLRCVLCSRLLCRHFVVLALFVLRLNVQRFLLKSYSPACSKYSDIWSRSLLLSDDCSSSISELSKSSACSCFFFADAISAACFFLHFVRLFWNHTCKENIIENRVSKYGIKMPTRMVFVLWRG